MQPKAIIIFIKNPEKGKVKTRLGKSIGEDKALIVYRKLLDHTRDVTSSLPFKKYLFYDNFINRNDEWNENLFDKRLQLETGDLGRKMENAFNTAFSENHTHVMIIGSDCPELNSKILNEAFLKLQQHDAVIGPAKDGGYYLLGMKKIHSSLFQNKKWSSKTVLEDTLSDFKKLGLSYSLLPVLADVDEEADLVYLQ